MLNYIFCFFFQQPRCALCDRQFVTTDAVLAHLKEAHPSATLATFTRTLQNQPCLIHKGYTYRHCYSGKNTFSWRCGKRGCSSSARTRGSHHLDVTSVVISATEHKHPASDAKARLVCIMNQVRKLVDETDMSGLAIRQKIFATLDPEVAAICPSQNLIQQLVYRRRKAAKAKKNGLYE